MKAMILAAGLGTRLRPLTDHRPKALVEIAGRTLLQITLSRLRTAGVGEVIINVHHFADQITEYLDANHNFGMRIELSREEVLLDTGGGLKKAAYFFLQESGQTREPFILHNVDIVSTVELRRMLEAHAQHQALATVAVQHRESSRCLFFDERLRLCGRRAGRDQEPEMVRSSPQAEALAFCGIHVVSPDIFAKMDEEGVFSIIRAYMRLAARGESILAFRADEYYWRDLGRPEAVLEAEQDFLQHGIL